MKARNWLNNNSAMVTILAVVVLILSLATIIITMRPASYTPRVIDVYYYDLDTKQLFVDKSDKYPPIATPSGGQKGARAYVFSCGDCADESQRFIGYLEVYTPEAKKILENPNADPAAMADPIDVYEDGRLLATEQGQQWHKASSVQGFEVMDAPQTRCGNNAPNSCNPGDAE